MSARSKNVKKRTYKRRRVDSGSTDPDYSIQEDAGMPIAISSANILKDKKYTFLPPFKRYDVSRRSKLPELTTQVLLNNSKDVEDYCSDSQSSDKYNGSIESNQLSENINIEPVLLKSKKNFIVKRKLNRNSVIDRDNDYQPPFKNSQFDSQSTRKARSLHCTQTSKSSDTNLRPRIRKRINVFELDSLNTFISPNSISRHKELLSVKDKNYSNKKKFRINSEIVDEQQSNEKTERGNLDTVSDHFPSPKRQGNRKILKEIKSKKITPILKKSKKKRESDETDQQSEIENKTGLRRSKRNRIPPLQGWRNECRLFRWKGDELLDIEYNPGTPEDTRSLKQIERKSSFRTKTKVSVEKQQTEVVRKIIPKLINNETNLALVRKAISKVPVIDPVSGKEELIYAHRPYDTLLWSVPLSQNQKDASFHVTKVISNEQISFGYIEIDAGKRKDVQQNPLHNINFTVLQGEITVYINDFKSHVKARDTVYVPASNMYSIHNTGKIEALLHFCCFKTPIFDYQFLEGSEDS